jgi:hypothetical protein
VSQREVILDADWRGIVAVDAMPLADLIGKFMSHEDSLEWTKAHVRRVEEWMLFPLPAGEQR